MLLAYTITNPDTTDRNCVRFETEVYIDDICPSETSIQNNETAGYKGYAKFSLTDGNVRETGNQERVWRQECLQY